MEADSNSRYFCLTAILISKSSLLKLAEEFSDLKLKYWDNGKYNYPKSGLLTVCFHSREIRRREAAFSNNAIDYTAFISDLTNCIRKTSFTITSTFVDKWLLYSKYKNLARNPYDLAVTFNLERIVKYQLKDTDSATLILEARNKDVDKMLDAEISRLIQNGTYYVSSRRFNKLSAVYFNPKREPHNQNRTYPGLELVDLVTYPIYNYCCGNKPGRDYDAIRSKFSYRIKIFP